MAEKKKTKGSDIGIDGVDGLSVFEICRLFILFELYRQRPRELPATTLADLGSTFLSRFDEPERIEASLACLISFGYIAYRYRALGSTKLYSLTGEGLRIVERDYGDMKNRF